MAGQCKECGSYAINPHCHGREPGVDLDLCDVCYWRARASAPRAEAVEAKRPAEADTRLLDWMATQHWVTVNCYADSFSASSLGKVKQRAQGYATLRGALETLRNADRAAIAQGADEGERNG